MSYINRHTNRVTEAEADYGVVGLDISSTGLNPIAMTTALAGEIAHSLDEVGQPPDFGPDRSRLLIQAVRAVGKVRGFFFFMWRVVYYTILLLGVASALPIVLGLLLIFLPGQMLFFGILAIVCPIYQK